MPPLQVPACTPQLSCCPSEWVTMDMQPDWALSDCDPACHLSAVTGEPPKQELLTCFLPKGFTKPWARENGCFTTPPSISVMCHTAVVSGKYQCMCVHVHVHVPAWVCMYTHVLNGLKHRHLEPDALGEKNATGCVTCPSSLLSLSLTCYQQRDNDSRSPPLMGLWKLICPYL